MRALDISELYLPLLHVQVIGVSLQVILLSVLDVFFYLDQRRTILFLRHDFLLFTPGTALVLLDLRLRRLEYETFMLQ